MKIIDDILINLLDEKYMNLIIWWESSSSHQYKKNDFFISFIYHLTNLFIKIRRMIFSSLCLPSHQPFPPLLLMLIGWIYHLISTYHHLMIILPSPPSSQLSFSPSERSTIYPFLLSSSPLFSYPTMV